MVLYTIPVRCFVTSRDSFFTNFYYITFFFFIKNTVFHSDHIIIIHATNAIDGDGKSMERSPWFMIGLFREFGLTA